MIWLFLVGQKANGFPPDKSSKSKKQKQQQRIRKEKPQQHNFTHRLLAAALKVHTWVPCTRHIQRLKPLHRLFLCSILCVLQTPWSLTKVRLDVPFYPFSPHPVSTLLLIQAAGPWSHGCTSAFPICPGGSCSHMQPSPLEPQWEHILHGL